MGDGDEVAMDSDPHEEKSELSGQEDPTAGNSPAEEGETVAAQMASAGFAENGGGDESEAIIPYLSGEDGDVAREKEELRALTTGEVTGGREISVDTRIQFLPEEFLDQEEAPESYPLEREFSRTKYNRNRIFFAMLAGFFIIVAGGAAGLAEYVKYKYGRIDVNIMDFSDSSLREMLVSARGDERRLIQANERLKIYKKELEEKIKKIRKEGQLRRREIGRRRLSRRKKIKLIYEQRKTEKEDIRGVQDQYREKIDRETKIANELGKKVAALNKEVQGKLEHRHNMESNARRLEKIKLNRVRRDLSEHYERIISNLRAGLRKKERSLQTEKGSINSYRYAFNYLARTRSESGFIVDPRDPDQIDVIIRSGLRVRAGEKAQVFRRDDEFIGVVEFIKTSGRIMAKTKSLEKGKKIRPFDSLFIKAGR